MFRQVEIGYHTSPLFSKENEFQKKLDTSDLYC